MALNLFLAVLAVLSLLLLLWQWLVSIRFPLHRRVQSSSFAPGVTLLKPLKGSEQMTRDCLRSWFSQQYTGPVQILFGVADANDSVCDVVRSLLSEFPAFDAQLLVCGPLTGANLKVSKLAQLEPRAKYDLLVVSDADVLVPSDLLANIVQPLRQTEVGLVNCFYRLALPGESLCTSAHPSLTAAISNQSSRPQRLGDQSPSTIAANKNVRAPAKLAMEWEAVAVNADFWSQVLQSRSLKPLDFALGAVMATRRANLRGIGGFESLKDCLADDYQLGHQIAKTGSRIELSPVVVECWSDPLTFGQVWRHQLRWARTIRVCQPAPYFFSILSNATFWPLLWLVVRPSPLALVFAAATLVLRCVGAFDLQRRLAAKSPHPRRAMLAPVKDLLQLALWLLAFAGDRVEWRGEIMRLRRDGTLVREPATQKGRVRPA